MNYFAKILATKSHIVAIVLVVATLSLSATAQPGTTNQQKYSGASVQNTPFVLSTSASPAGDPNEQASTNTFSGPQNSSEASSVPQPVASPSISSSGSDDTATSQPATTVPDQPQSPANSCASCVATENPGSNFADCPDYCTAYTAPPVSSCGTCGGAATGYRPAHIVCPMSCAY